MRDISLIFHRIFLVLNKGVSWIFSLQNCRSLLKLKVSIGSFILDATFTKKLLNSLAMSIEFSIIQTLINKYLHCFYAYLTLFP